MLVLHFIFPEGRLGVVTMRRDELMKPDFLSEFVLLVSGALSFPTATVIR